MARRRALLATTALPRWRGAPVRAVLPLGAALGLAIYSSMELVSTCKDAVQAYVDGLFLWRQGQEVICSARESCSNMPHGLSLDFDHKCYHIAFRQHAGPGSMGRLLIAPRGPSPITDLDVKKFLSDLDDLAAKQLQMDCTFVCIFDISRIVWPSMMSVPSILRLVAKHKLSEDFKQRTQAFAIVCHRGGWFEGVIDAIIAIKKAESVPIFAGDLRDAERLLDAKFATC